MSTPRKILIYRCGTLGDTLVALPAINTLRQCFEGSRFILMTASDADGKIWADTVLRDFGWFDGFITYRPASVRTLTGLRALAKRVRAEQPDLVAHLGSDWNWGVRIWRDRLFFTFAGTRRFIYCPSPKVTPWGRLRGRDGTYPQETMRLLRGLAHYGLRNGAPSFDIPIRGSHRKRISELLAGQRLDEGRPLVGMCPGAKQPIKRWPAERFGELGNKLIGEAGVDVAVVGGPEEAAIGDQLGPGWPPGRWINLAGRLSVFEAAALLSRCVFYVGNDTGAMHLAAAVGTRCVGIFSAREPPRTWHPYGDNHVVLRKYPPCRNCYLQRCDKEQVLCLAQISVSDVWEACQRTLTFH